MKKVTAVLMSIFLSFGLAACGSTQDDRKPEAIDRMVESVETEPSAAGNGNPGGKYRRKYRRKFRFRRGEGIGCLLLHAGNQ